MKQDDKIKNVMKIYIMISGIIILGAVAVLDIVTGTEFSFSIFYLAPVLMVTWYGDRLTGIVISFIAAIVTWAVSDFETLTLNSNMWIPYWNAFVRLSFFLVTCFIIASLKEALEHQKCLAKTDSLTGAENIRSFNDLAEIEIERIRRNNKPLSIAYIDLDNFKYINDTQGHTAGNALLQTTADTMKNNLRKIDVLARMGGDEFAILLPETDEIGSVTTMERIREKLVEAMQAGGWPVTFSIGVASFGAPPASVDDMLSKADTLMYEVKNNGKDKIRGKTF